MPQFTHLNERGEANMVDVADKPTTTRIARAEAVLRMAPATMAALQASQLKKGDALAVARIAGIQAAKRTADLIPLCHPLPLTKVEITFDTIADDALRIETLCRVDGRTGVEMEALTAASVAALTVYDMCKALDRAMTIEAVQLIEKRGGQRGDYVRPQVES
ncbi:MAG: cyclic pyranopterin monophosphate synthase MoaC [Pseudomonadota bacterium]